MREREIDVISSLFSDVSDVMADIILDVNIFEVYVWNSLTF